MEPAVHFFPFSSNLSLVLFLSALEIPYTKKDAQINLTMQQPEWIVSTIVVDARFQIRLVGWENFFGLAIFHMNQNVWQTSGYPAAAAAAASKTDWNEDRIDFSNHNL